MNVPIENFWKNDENLEGIEAEILINLTQEVNWKRKRKYDLLRRIRKIARRKEFSVRETKMIKKLIRKQMKEGFMNFEAIKYYFPGKTAEMIKDNFLNKAE